MREELVRKGVVFNNQFTEDFIFSSPSYAAAVVMGRSANGLTEWKTIDGRILKNLETSLQI
ncbi:hypothetical protein D3C87_1913420 [compost metagenome]